MAANEVEWQEVFLEELAASTRNALVGGPFGSDLMTSDYSSMGVPVIRGENLSLGRWVGGDFVFVPPTKAQQLAANTAGAFDIVFTQRGANHYRQVAVVPPNTSGRLVISQSQMKLTVDSHKADPLFIYYLFRTRAQQEYLQRNAIQTGVPHTNLSILKRTPLRIPSLPTQRAIVRILGTLDDKIELNRQMNETLEAMAWALFKSWFVDFDPVRAKTEGRAPGLPKPLADLFPTHLVDSELGTIPERWLVTRWGELVTLKYGKSLTGYDEEAGAYPVYGTNGRIGRHSKPLCEHPGIIIGRKGAYRGVHFCGEPFFVIDTAFYVEPRKPVELRWAYYELLLRQDINSMDSGSAIPSTSREDFYSLPVLSPPFELQQAFAGLLNLFWVRQKQGDQESSTLAALRDTLLPKLVSGELRVRDAERIVENPA